MQELLKMDFHREAEIQYPYHGLPEDLNQTNATEFAIPVCDQDYDLPGALLHRVTLLESRLYQANDHL